MISMSHMKTLSKSKPTDVWCLDSLGKHTIRFDRLSLCSQIEAIPIEDVVAILIELQLEIEEKEQYYQDKFLEGKNAVHDAAMGGIMFGCGECKELVQQKINSLKEDAT